MLPRARRITIADEFTVCVRRGARAGTRTVVAHLFDRDAPAAVHEPARAGFIVGKSVGNSVIRHRVVRRLRHVTGPLLDTLPAGALLVIRALPASARASSAELARDCAAGIERAGSRARSSAVAGSGSPR
ncbi:MAG: ribonuclease P protein component [Actinomycetales bacterium]